MVILLLAHEEDTHLQRVRSVLDQKQADYICFDWSQYPERSFASVKTGTLQNTLFTLKSRTRTIRNEDVTAVWNRRPKTPKIFSELKPGIKKYIETEAKDLAETLHLFTSHAVWVPSPSSVVSASRKPYQLLLAEQLGLRVPNGCIGNDPDDVAELCEKHESLIIKSLLYGACTLDLNWIHQIKKLIYNIKNRKLLQSYPPEHPMQELIQYRSEVIIPTRLVSNQELLGLLKDIPTCPVIIQEYVPKKLELRITVVGNQVFACGIYSQESAVPENKVDWRHDAYASRHEAYHLPAEVEAKCLQLVHRLGLNYAAIDMIVTPNDEYVFLEINPIGQWLWIQELTGMPIAEAIADLLINAAIEQPGRQYFSALPQR